MMLASLPIDMSTLALALNDPKLFFRRIALVAVLPPTMIPGFPPNSCLQSENLFRDVLYCLSLGHILHVW